MKRKVFVGLLSAEAAACVLFCVFQTSFAGSVAVAMAFPFEQVGRALRSLSLSSGVGNAAAIAVYIALSLLPAVALLFFRIRRKLFAEDGLLGLLAAVLFAVLYIMINPGDIGSLIGGAAGQAVGKAVLGGMVYSVLCGYLILRIVRLFSESKTEELARYITITLGFLNVIFVYLLFGACFSGLLNSIDTLRTGNAGNEHLLGASYVFLAMQFIVDALPYVFNVIIVFAALDLFTEMRIDRYSAETAAAAARTSRLCTAALVATVLSGIGFNLLQLVFAKSLAVINSSVQIPVFSIAFVLAALLLSRLVTENKQLKDDNDSFI